MLQSIVFFVLGFLSSGFLALMVAPAVWRRAVVLTRKRIEASVPLSLAEIQADKDRMRAELAMTIRRLEMTVKLLREKSAAQAVEIGRGREELKRLAGERDEHSHGLSQSEAKAGELDAELGKLRQQLKEHVGKLADAQKALDAKSAELDNVGRLYEEASFAAASRQIELVARQSEIETLSGENAERAAGRQEAERRHQELLAENRSVRDALEEERRRADRLEEANAELAAAVRQREETLEGREQQLARLRGKLNGAASEEESDSGTPPAGQADGSGAGVSGQAPELASEALVECARTSAPELSAERDRLQGRLAAMIGELAGPDNGAAGTRPGSGGEEGRQDAMLREQMSDLAAEMIRLTAKLDGPDSPIARALSASAEAAEPGGDASDRVTSLADRVRALQRAASPG